MSKRHIFIFLTLCAIVLSACRPGAVKTPDDIPTPAATQAPQTPTATSVPSPTASPTATSAPGVVDPNFHIYLMFGQSNMEGQGPIEPQDRTANPRVMVLQSESCASVKYGKWRVASPPLIRCNGRIGPGDTFGKAMAENTDPAITIGLVGAAYQGQSIDFFLKDCAQRDTCDPVNPNGPVPESHNGGYEWLLDLAQKAQEVGVIKGILMHQGETDTGDSEWKHKVSALVTNLRNDLELGDDVPLLAGELLYAEYDGCCGAWHNPEIARLPDVLSNAHVISAEGLAGADYAHFTTEAYREFGQRYAAKMLELVDTAPAPGP